MRVKITLKVDIQKAGLIKKGGQAYGKTGTG